MWYTLKQRSTHDPTLHFQFCLHFFAFCRKCSTKLVFLLRASVRVLRQFDWLAGGRGWFSHRVVCDWGTLTWFCIGSLTKVKPEILMKEFWTTRSVENTTSELKGTKVKKIICPFPNASANTVIVCYSVTLVYIPPYVSYNLVRWLASQHWESLASSAICGKRTLNYKVIMIHMFVQGELRTMI